MTEEKFVGIGEIIVSHNPDVLKALGIGSCVAVILYDKEAHIGGLAHVMLPESKDYVGRIHNSRSIDNLTRYADIAIPKMIDDMEKAGANIKSIRAKIAGGAQMFPDIKGDIGNVGIRNADAVKKSLKEKNIHIEAEDIGGNFGRSVRFDITTQKVSIKTIIGEKDL